MSEVSKLVRCGTCTKIRNAIPMPQRLRESLEQLEDRRIARKQAKRLRKARG